MLVGCDNPKNITEHIAPSSILITEKPNFQEIKNSKLKWKN